MNFLKAASTISGLTLLSRITGLVRDQLIARQFGASALTDAFWLAFRIPNLLRRLFAEGAFSQAFVPILGQVKAESSHQESQRYISQMASVLVFALLLVTIIGIVGAPTVVFLLGSGLHGPTKTEGLEAAVFMTRLMFPYIIAMSLVALSSGILNTWKNFTIPAVTPVLLNLSMIGAAVLLQPFFAQPVYALAIGVLIGGFLQLAIQIPALKRLGLLPRLQWNLRDALRNPMVRKTLKKMLPAILGVSVAQISLIINTNIATWLADGSVSWLSFADRLMEFPTALLGIAIGTVLIPSLSSAYQEKDHLAYSQRIDWGLRLVLLLGTPCAIGLLFFSEAVISVLFQYGSFTAHDTLQTTSAVQAYGVGLIGILSVKILAPGFYAQQNIKTPVKIAIMVLVVTQIMNILFVPLYAHAGLALSIGIGSLLNALALGVGLLRRKMYTPQKGWILFLIRLITCCFTLALLLFYLSEHIHWVQLLSWERLLTFCGCFIVIILVYFTCLWLVGFRLKDFVLRTS